MSDWDLVQRFSLDYLADSDDVVYLEEASIEHGVSALGRILGHTIQQIARAMDAKHIVEVGTGVGVLTMRLAEACPSAHITSIDVEPDHHVTFKELMPEVGLDSTRVRLITERAGDVLPKMNDNSYDLVVFDIPADDVEASFRDAVTICRPGGAILVCRALVGGQIADPATRTAAVTSMRRVLKAVAEDDRVDHTLVPAGEGLLWAQVHRDTASD